MRFQITPATIVQPILDKTPLMKQYVSSKAFVRTQNIMLKVKIHALGVQLDKFQIVLIKHFVNLRLHVIQHKNIKFQLTNAFIVVMFF